jgi:hypothetical protein
MPGILSVVGLSVVGAILMWYLAFAPLLRRLRL